MRPRWVAGVVLLLVPMVGAVHAAPPEEAIIPIERYTSPKARALALTHQRELRQIYDAVHRCYTWMDIPQRGLGFVAPKGGTGDERYLTVWVWIEQRITPAFAAASSHGRASAMLQRYGVDLLRRLSSHLPLREDPSLTGFAVVLTWMKPGAEPQPGTPGVNETVSVFVDKTTLQQFLHRQTRPAEFVQRAIVNGFDGTTELGRLRLELGDPGSTTDGVPAC